MDSRYRPFGKNDLKRYDVVVVLLRMDRLLDKMKWKVHRSFAWGNRSLHCWSDSRFLHSDCGNRDMAESDAKGRSVCAVRTQGVKDIVGVADKSLLMGVCFWESNLFWCSNGTLDKEGDKQI